MKEAASRQKSQQAIDRTQRSRRFTPSKGPGASWQPERASFKIRAKSERRKGASKKGQLKKRHNRF
jgi:hypothetical protein